MPPLGIDIDKLTNAAARFDEVELRGGVVLVRPARRSDGSTAVLATFEDAKTAESAVAIFRAMDVLLGFARGAMRTIDPAEVPE
jgi:hypothetical protein